MFVDTHCEYVRYPWNVGLYLNGDIMSGRGREAHRSDTG